MKEGIPLEQECKLKSSSRKHVYNGD